MSESEVVPHTTIGLDVGGTKVAAGLVAPDGTVLRELRRPTPADNQEALVDLLRLMVDELTPAAGPPPAVGVGLPALVDLDGTARFGVNVGIAELRLAHLLADRVKRPVVVHNDANVAAWGEFRAGAGAGSAAMVLLTVGTGVGGGVVLGGQLLRGAHGFGGELGHVVVDEGGPECPCGNHGCLEAHASGTAIGRTAREAQARGTLPAGSPLRSADPLTGAEVTAAALEGDQAARAILARAGFWLGVGIGSLVNVFDPDVVVIGGGALAAGDLLLEPARRAARERVEGAAHRPLPRVVPARFGEDAGIVGAALLAADETTAPA